MPAITDKFGRASIVTDAAIATTVKTTRAPGVLVLEAYDLSKFAPDTPVFFVTYKKTTDPVTNITSVTNLVSYKALVNPGVNTLTNLTVAPGYVDLGNAVGDFVECIPTSYWENSLLDGIFVGHNPDGTFKKSQLQADLGNDGRLVATLDEITSDAIISGGIWSIVSGLNGAMTALGGYIDGYKNTVAAVASRSYTVSKDTYVDVLRNTSTNAFSLVYTEVANGAAAPALAANSVRIAKVVTNGTAITSIVQAGSDSLNNPILPTGVVAPSNRAGGYRTGVISAATFGTTGNKSITGLGFRPKMVRFSWLPVDQAGMGEHNYGCMDDNGNQYAVGGSAWGGGGANQHSMSKTDHCIIRQKWQLSTTPLMSAKYVSMDVDGFTINVDIANSEVAYAWEAFA